MKKILFSLSALFAFGFAQAQDNTEANGFTKGDVFISGTVGYSTRKIGDNLKSHDFTITPAVGYFVSDNIALGLMVGYNNSKNNYNNYGSLNQTNNQFSAGLSGRYYFNPSDKFNVFTELGVSYVNRKVEQENSSYDPIYSPTTSEYKENGFAVGFAPGFNYWLSSHFALEANVGILSYNSFKPDQDGAVATDTFSVGLDLSNVNFGLIYKF